MRARNLRLRGMARSSRWRTWRRNKDRNVLESVLVERGADGCTRPSIMSEGAMMSAPARAWETAVLARISSEASLTISNSVARSDGCGGTDRLGNLANDSAVTVRHVFAKADVAHDEQAGNVALDGAGGALHDSVVGPSPGGDLVLLFGKAEENDRLDAERLCTRLLPSRLRRRID